MECHMLLAVLPLADGTISVTFPLALKPEQSWHETSFYGYQHPHVKWHEFQRHQGWLKLSSKHQNIKLFKHPQTGIKKDSSYDIQQICGFSRCRRMIYCEYKLRHCNCKTDIVKQTELPLRKSPLRIQDFRTTAAWWCGYYCHCAANSGLIPNRWKLSVTCFG